MVVRTVVHFEIPANDIERLSRFYHKCFGWTFKEVGMPGLEYWIISTGPRGKSVGGGMFRKESPDQRPRNFIAVDRIDPAIRTFRAAGGTQIVGKMEVPGMGWSFIGADPEGNVIALWEPKMAPAARRRRSAKRRRSTGRRPRVSKRRHT